MIDSINNIVSIFILPPSLAVLKERLLDRRQDSIDIIEKRMSKAIDEMKHWSEYDYVIINEDIDDSVNKVRTIIHSERLRVRYQSGLDKFVEGLSR